MIKKIIERYIEEEVLKADGFDDAIIGVCADFNTPVRLIYSVKKSLEILIKRDKMKYEDALEYFNFNVSGAYVGDKTPVWCHDEFD